MARHPDGVAYLYAVTEMVRIAAELQEIAARESDDAVVVGPAGRRLAAWGSRGSGPGQFDSSPSIASDGRGNVYVADLGFDRRGRLHAVTGGQIRDGHLHVYAPRASRRR